jgi:hypothetical protein
MLYYASRISDNIHKREPEGYLICVNVPIARTGTQDYAQDEIGQDGDRLIKVYRPEEEVFSEATMASFEGMPVTNDHPDDPDGVNIDNWHFLNKGHCEHVRRGTGKDRDLLIADLVINDPQTIEDVENGKREISCGYTYELCEEDGKYVQRQIRGNHIAIVDRGRAGHRVCIKDSAPTNERRISKMATNTKKKSHVGILSRMLAALTATDAEPEVLEEAIDAIEDITGGEAAPVEPEQPEEEAKDEDPMAAILARLDALEAAVGAKGADEEPEEAPAEEEDPLKKLEDDLDELEGGKEEEEEVVPDEDPDEQESHFVDPEEINEEDEDPEDEEVIEEEEEISDCKARDAVRDTIRTMRPIIAKLPKAEQKKASDALAAQLRKSYGLAPKAERNDYLRLKAARKKTADSAKEEDPQDLGRAIMASRNPHFKK